MEDLIAFNDLTTVADPAAWVLAEDGKTYTHPGLFGWAITLQGGKFTVTGDFNGGEGHPFGTYPTLAQAVAATAYANGV